MRQLTETDLVDFVLDRATENQRRKVAHQLSDDRSYASRWLGFIRAQCCTGPLVADLRSVLDVNDDLEAMRISLYGPGVSTRRVWLWLASNAVFWTLWATLTPALLVEDAGVPLMSWLLTCCIGAFIWTSLRAIRTRQLPTGTLIESIIGGCLFLGLAAFSTEALEFLSILTAQHARHLIVLTSFLASWLGMFRGFVLAEQFVAEELTMRRVMTQWLYTMIGLSLLAATGGLPLLLLMGDITTEQWRMLVEITLSSLAFYSALCSLRYRFSESLLYGGLLASAGMVAGFLPYIVDSWLNIIPTTAGVWLTVATATASYGLWWKTALNIFGDSDVWTVRPIEFLQHLEGLILGQCAASVLVGMWLTGVWYLPHVCGSAAASLVTGGVWLGIFAVIYLTGRYRKWLRVTPPQIRSAIEQRLERLTNAGLRFPWQHDELRPAIAALPNPVMEVAWLVRSVQYVVLQTR